MENLIFCAALAEYRCLAFAELISAARIMKTSKNGSTQITAIVMSFAYRS